MMQSLDDLRAGKYKGTRRLKLSCGLTEFPREILDLYDTLEILDLSNNPLSTLPKEIHRLHKLKVAFFSDCNFTTFPKGLAQCRSLEMIAFKNNGMTTISEGVFPRKLRWLILTNNKIESLPHSIGSCHRLQKIWPTKTVGQQDRSFTPLVVQSSRIVISFVLWKPCTPSNEDNPTLDDISWSDLKIDHLLGEGASGIISKGVWKSSTAEKNVAVKLFKGEVTSDGVPADEMNACITAGRHPNLIDPIGKIHGHPEKRGLVLELIPPHYTNLGLPPTLDSCTRDAFHPETFFSIEKCRAILISIASASKHLHERGITHGDLYAHNILIDDSGHALLGDFGAATIYQKGYEHSEAIEKMEVFAFGHLIEDMLGLVARKVVAMDNLSVCDEKEGYAIEELNLLHYKCTNPIVMDRPLFSEICTELCA
ncbi:serine threonine-protein kinase [Botrytis cinerea]